MNSFECLDVGLNDSYIFRQAQWKFMGWKDKYITQQENEKIRQFSDQLFRSYQENIIAPIKQWVDANIQISD
jgi:hypothetical protein